MINRVLTYESTKSFYFSVHLLCARRFGGARGTAWLRCRSSGPCILGRALVDQERQGGDWAGGFGMNHSGKMGRGDVCLGKRRLRARGTILCSRGWHLGEELGLCFTTPGGKSNSISQNHDGHGNEKKYYLLCMKGGVCQARNRTLDIDHQLCVVGHVLYP